MRILIIHRSFALVGGAERVIIDKANYLTARGHDVMLTSYEQGNHPISYELNPEIKFKDLNCRFFTLSKHHPIAHFYHFIRLKQIFKESLRAIIADFKPEVIVLASDWNFLIKSVITVAGAIPVICEFHNSYDFIVKNIGNTGNRLKDMLTKAYYHHVIKNVGKCFRLVSLTEADARHWRKIAKSVWVIPNPVVFFPEVIDDVKKVEGRILFAGRLNAPKRIDYLITAFSQIAHRHPQWHIAIFGEGMEKDALESLIKSLGLERRVVINNPTPNIYEEYKKAQMLVLSSKYEAFGLVLIEAMSCGTPCISFDCPSGPAEIIDDKITGLLAKNGDIKDLAEKMEWLIIHDEERKEMGCKARIAAEKYKPSVIMKEWEKAYTSLQD